MKSKKIWVWDWVCIRHKRCVFNRGGLIGLPVGRQHLATRPYFLDHSDEWEINLPKKHKKEHSIVFALGYVSKETYLKQIALLRAQEQGSKSR